MRGQAIRLLNVRRDYYTNESQIIFDGIGSIYQSEDKLKLSYKEDDNTNVDVIVSDNTIKIYRENVELLTSMACELQNVSPIQIATDYGTITLKVFTHHLLLEDKELTFVYDIISGNKVIESYSMNWKWEEKP